MAAVAFLLGCPAMGDGAVEQQRRKGATSSTVRLSCGGRRTSGAAMKKERDREGKKQIKNKKMCAEKILKLPPMVVATWLVINLGKATYC